MTADEIFRKIAEHMVKGVMFHTQMAEYYEFLSLPAYAEEHAKHAAEEMAAFGKLKRFYITRFDRLIAEGSPENPNVIPQSWLKHTRQDVDVGTLRSAVKTGVEGWVKWESETKALYESMHNELMTAGEVAAACAVRKLVEAVDKELCAAKQKHFGLKAVDYAADYILDRQAEKKH